VLAKGGTAAPTARQQTDRSPTEHLLHDDQATCQTLVQRRMTSLKTLS